MRRLLLILPALVAFYLSSQAQPDPTQGFKAFLVQKGLDKKYEINGFLKPAFFKVDLNNDGVPDYAFSISNKYNKKKGIMLIRGRSNAYVVIGAGTRFGNGGNDIKWAAGWNIYRRPEAYVTSTNRSGDITKSKKIKLKRPGLYVYDLVDGQPNAGGIIYWNGKKYVWLQQGE
jgi:hypothetical protein